MKKIIILLVILVAIFSAGCKSAKEAINYVEINKKQFIADIADTEEERSQGLSGREKLVDDHGLLFIFPEKGEYGFWMKQMKFNLDIIWISGNTIVDIKENLPAEKLDTPDSELTIYYPQKPADKVFELLAGSCQKYDIKVGDIVNGI